MDFEGGANNCQQRDCVLETIPRVYATTRAVILGNSTGGESEKIPSFCFGAMPRR